MRDIIRYIKRALLGEQGTSQLVFQPYNGLAPVSYSGTGTRAGSLIVCQPATVAPGPTVVRADPTVTGNNATTIALSPLQDNHDSATVLGAQF